MEKSNKESIRELASQILEMEIDVSEREEIIHLLISKQTTENPNKYSYAERASDKFAKVAGNWTFVISFSLILLYG